MFIEFFIGYRTNSLSLLSDAFHMCCDNLSLFISSLASAISTSPPTSRFSYGFGYAKIVCGFSNTIFLFFISLNLTSEAIERLINPLPVGGDGLLIVSIGGLLINLLGLFFTNPNNLNNDNINSPEQYESEIQKEKSNSTTNNLKKSAFLSSIYLHVMIDTIGSFIVIFSSFFVEKFELFWLDSVCSLIIAIFIAYTGKSLLFDLIKSLILKAPYKLNYNDLIPLNSEIQNQSLNFWLFGNQPITTLHISGKNSSDLSLLKTNLQKKNINDSTIEVTVV